jgi:uncharacterized protein with FMN-binding domain
VRPRTRLLPVIAPAGTTAVVVALLALKPTSDPALQADRPYEAAGTAAARSTALPRQTGPTDPSSRTVPTTSAPTPTTRPEPSSSTASATRRSATTTASASPTTSGPSPTRTATTVTVTGASVTTKYGPVQVRITVQSGRITSATAIQYPDSTARSRELSSKAVPVLEDETVAAQSASIDAVSGATYTSTGYTQSLQSALDKAGL